MAKVKGPYKSDKANREWREQYALALKALKQYEKTGRLPR